jgi:hypothetical protein
MLFYAFGTFVLFQLGSDRIGFADADGRVVSVA